MANDVFNIATDLSIRYFNQTLSAYVDIVADSFEVDIDRGIEVEKGVFAQASVGVATVKLVKKNLADFLGTPGYKAGDLFDIRYKPNPDTAPTTYNTIYAGYIQNVSMGYINESGTLEITIVANDVMRYCMNQVLTSFSVTGVATNRSFRNCMIPLFSALSTASTYSPSGVSLTAVGAGASGTTQLAYTWTNEPAGTILERFLNAELGWAWADKAVANNVKYATRTDIDTKKAVAYVAGLPTVSNVHYNNFIFNGDFEVNTSGWTTFAAGTTLSRVTSTYYTGVASLRVANSLTTSALYSFTTNTGMTALPDSKYKASIWIKGEVNTKDARIQIAYKNTGGTTLQLDSGDFTTVNTSGWTQLSVTSVAPVNTAFVELRVQVNKTSAAIGSMFADNAKIEDLTTIRDNHYCLDGLDLNYDSDILVNRAVVVDSMTGSRTTASNSTSISANGLRADEFYVNLDNAGLSTYATLASRIANAATLKQVYGVTLPVIRDDGRVGTIANYEIADTLQVEFAQEPLPTLQVVSLIRRINHVITPQLWIMNVGLWRGV
jgi:hypothetical protein